MITHTQSNQYNFKFSDVKTHCLKTHYTLYNLKDYKETWNYVKLYKLNLIKEFLI